MQSSSIAVGNSDCVFPSAEKPRGEPEHAARLIDEVFARPAWTSGSVQLLVDIHLVSQTQNPCPTGRQGASVTRTTQGVQIDVTHLEDTHAEPLIQQHPLEDGCWGPGQLTNLLTPPGPIQRTRH